MTNDLLTLKILLPTEIFADWQNILSLRVETTAGSFGILPHRLDCVAALVPGILSFVTSAGKESYVVINEGVLIKTGVTVSLSVRNAIGGSDLALLRSAVQQEFIKRSEQDERERRSVRKLESRLMRRLTEFSHD